MTSYLQCDYCGEPIDEDEDRNYVTIDARGFKEDDDCGWSHVNGYLGHYHASHDQPCYQRIRDGIRLVNAVAPSLEQIPTATAQKIARLRRTHKKAD